MKEVRIKIEDIGYSYGKLTGDLGAKEFIKNELDKGGFDLDEPYKKRVLDNYIVFTQ